MRLKFLNGRVLTLDPARPEATAVAISGDRIVAVGADDPVQALDLPGATVVDLKGRTLLPGFIDSHVHAFATGLLDAGVDLRAAATVEEVCARIRSSAERETPGGWIYALGCSPWELREKRFPTLEELDAATPDNPVYLCSSTFHSGATNSSGLHRLSASAAGAAAAAPAAVAARAAAGRNEPGWFLDDESHFEASRAAFGDLTDAQIEELYRGVADRAARKGVTTLHCLEGQFVAGDRDVLALHAIADALPVAIHLMYQTMDVARVLAMGLPRIGGCLTVDGACFEHTACFYEPYVDEPGTRGFLNYGQSEVAAFVLEAHSAGLQIGMHAIGDRAIDLLVQAYADAQRAAPRSDCRHRIEHFQAPTDHAVREAQRLGLALPMQPVFSYLWDRPDANHYEESFGRSRAARMEDFAAHERLGLLVSGGSDSPVTPIDPLLGIHAAVNNPRESRRVAVDAALRLFTVNGAWVGHQDHETGSVTVGKRADLVVLEASPFEESEAIDDIEVLMTVSRGEMTWTAAATTLA